MKILIMLIIGILLFPTVSALQFKNSCTDNQTLNEYMNFTSCDGTTCTDYNYTQNVACVFGCDESLNECRQSPMAEYGLFGLTIAGIIIVIGVIIYLFRR